MTDAQRLQALEGERDRFLLLVEETSGTAQRRNWEKAAQVACRIVELEEKLEVDNT